MKDIIPAKKERPILGLTGLGGGVGSPLIGGGGDITYVDDVFAPSLYLSTGEDKPIQSQPNAINLGTSNSGRSVYFNGFNDSLTSRYTADYCLGNNEFCMEAWVYHEGAFDNYDVIWGNWGSGTTGYVWEFVGTQDANVSDLEFYYHDSDNNFVGPIQGGTMSKNSWHHVAITRTLASGNLTFRLFIDGVMHGTGTQNNTTIRNGNSDFVMGAASGHNGTGGQFTGYISNFRLTVGEPVYTANFTPSTEELTTTSQGVTASNVKLLCCQGETVSAATKQTAYPYQLRSQKMGAPSSEAFGPFTSSTSSDGGMVWFKGRSNTGNPNIVDSIRGGTSYSFTNTTQVGTDTGYHIKTFNAGGFTVQNNGSGSNAAGEQYVGWTFKTQKKFFTQLQYDGNGVNRQIPHDLGSVPGMMMIKRIDGGGSSSYWRVYHRSNNGGTTPQNYAIWLDRQNEAVASPTSWNDTAPTALNFTVGTHEQVNHVDGTYMAYLFAHDAGGFGEDDESIVKCGGYTGNGSNDGPEINLGWEPQYIYIKRAVGGSEHWILFDTARQISNMGTSGTSSEGAEFDIETSANATERQSINWLHVTTTGFKIDVDYNHINGNSSNKYIYLAIRRPDGKVGRPPTADTAANYFHSAYSRAGTPNHYTACSTLPFAPDTCIMKQPTGGSAWLMGTRQTGKAVLECNDTTTQSYNQYWEWDYPRGWQSYTGDNTSWQTWGWKRGLTHDVVAYKGNGTAGRQFTHGMNAVPEMIWVKSRDNSTNWGVYHVGLNDGTNPENYRIFLNEANGNGGDTTYWNDTAPTKTTVTVGSNNAVNQNGFNFVMYLFASVNGVSKCGYYTGTGATGNAITDVGFRPRFVIIKRTDYNTTDNWYQLDTTRGINAATGLSGGQDLWLKMNSNASNQADPFFSLQDNGFTITDTGFAINGTGAKYIYYAHA